MHASTCATVYIEELETDRDSSCEYPVVSAVFPPTETGSKQNKNLTKQVHRIGRTGRAGEKGVALTYLLPHELDRVNDIVTSMKKSGQPVPDELAEVARQNPPRRF